MEKSLRTTKAYYKSKVKVLTGFVAMLVAVVLLTRGSSQAAEETSPVCPGSPASVHAKCQMTVSFTVGCQQVLEEVTARLNHENGWVDPHNQGTYKLISSSGSDDDALTMLHASRTTGNGKYTDLMNLQFTEYDNGECVLETCSESQVTSILDFSTNFCNLHNLYCNESYCNNIHHSLQYKEDFESCSQNTVSKCATS